MKQSKRPLWKKSMLETLNFSDIIDYLDEIDNNGDMYGYDCDESGYYLEYKEQFDELSYGAYKLCKALREHSVYSETDICDIWDDMTVALLGYTKKVLGYDVVEDDYFSMLYPQEEDYAVEEAEKRLMRLTKEQLIKNFRKVLTTLILFFDIKASHDCLTSIVEELDERGAILEQKNERINKLYEELTGSGSKEFDKIISSIPPRMWVE